MGSENELAADDSVKPISRRERRKQEVRGRITEAAIGLFSEQGCDLTTVEEICEIADVARKTFYNYYPSKQQLIVEISELLLLGEAEDRLEQAVEKFETTPERLEFFFAVLADNLVRYGLLEKTLIKQTMVELTHEDGRSGHLLGALNQAFLRVLRDGIEQGDVSTTFSVEFLAEMMVGGINAVMLNWVHSDDYPVIERSIELSAYIQAMIKV